MSNPKPPEHIFSLDLILGTLQHRLDIWLDGERVPLVEAQPDSWFSSNEIDVDIKYFDVGGSDGHNLSGRISALTIVFGRAKSEINLITIRVMAIVFLLVLGLRTYARRMIKPCS